MGSVRFYSVSERRRYDPSRSVTGSSTDEVRRSLYPAHGREADTGTGRGNDFGVSVRTVRRWEDRYEADGAEGLYDRRLGKLANNRVPTDTAMEMLTLFDSKYRDYSPRHFHEKLVTHHGFTRSYNWVRLTLQSHGRVQPAPRRGAHRRKRPRRPMVGMMLH